VGPIIFVDPSVFVAILAKEPEGKAFAESIAMAERRMTSPIVRLETCIVLASRLGVEPSQAAALFDEFVAEAEIIEISVDSSVGVSAVACFENFGKGRHRARLNFVDRLVHASAKTSGARLSFKGGDFSQTDVNTPA
jgi:ribonuclease VapC